ncbi:SRPBCC family protein [Nocardioides jiangxiensis]|uniref:SRPBCC family protein n=1 Tax=Nocardioides jiangxiensis TaxID=3064524 RepID=A0ABT9B020_9ACTN|nr:SRPBCC family protein [Nocardioides sp. WY-20]MDO7868196.1 SRPBCC family protein [Nocardioides sp. WY-20]
MPFDAPTLVAETDIAAPPAVVWSMISDLPRMASWSPQVVKTLIPGGSTRAGARMVNLNRNGWKFWPTFSRVTVFEPEQQVAFRVADNWLHWSFELTPTADGGTHVRHSRTAPDGLSPVSAYSQKLAMGGTEKFDGVVEAGMRETLTRLKAEAEA